jgi:hypothetical protein
MPGRNRLWGEAGRGQHRVGPEARGSNPPLYTPAGRPGNKDRAMPIRNRIPERKPSMLSVTDGTTCVGFVLARGPAGFEAFDFAGKSFGMFSTQRDAVLAIPKRKPAQ